MAHLWVHTETLIVNALDCQLWIFMIGHVDRSLRMTNMDWWWIIIGVIWMRVRFRWCYHYTRVDELN